MAIATRRHGADGVGEARSDGSGLAAPSRTSLNLRVRRYVPSISRLTYVPMVRFVLDLLDIVPRLVYREFRALPPNHLRVRVGVSNRIFANQALHMTRGAALWMYWFASGWCGLDSDIVELGVGCGRWAAHVRDLSHHGDRYRGRYLGIDIDAEALDWCRDHFDGRFEFAQATHASTSYVNDAADPAPYRIPRDDASVDFVLATSVFTHLLEGPARNYLDECARVLRPGAKMAVTCFCVDLHPAKVGDRHSFRHRLDHAYIESQAQPEAAVGYESTFLCERALAAGFREARIMHTPNDTQQMLVCTR